MHIVFDPQNINWSSLTDNQNNQWGGYNVFRGIPYQRGNGLGSVFRSFFRYLLPIGKEIGSIIGKQGFESGNRILNNVLEGKSLKDSLVNEGRSGLKNLLQKAADNVDKQSGKGFDFKRYKNIGKTNVGFSKMNDEEPNQNKTINKHLYSRIGPPNFIPKLSRNSKKSYIKKSHSPKKKRVRIDTLGTY